MQLTESMVNFLSDVYDKKKEKRKKKHFHFAILHFPHPDSRLTYDIGTAIVRVRWLVS
jgi:hypothetical protein